MMAEGDGSGTKVLRVGVLTEIPSLDPLKAHDNVSLVAVSQVFETPYGYPSGEGPAVPRLFAEALRAEPEAPDVYSAPIRDGVSLLRRHGDDPPPCGRFATGRTPECASPRSCACSASATAAPSSR